MFVLLLARLGLKFKKESKGRKRKVFVRKFCSCLMMVV